MGVYWQQNCEQQQLLDEVKLWELDDDDEIRKTRIPKIGRRIYHWSGSIAEVNNNKMKQPIVRSSSIQDSLDEQIKTKKNILKLQETLGVEIVQENGQRKLGGPPPGWTGPPPGQGCEIFVGKLPRYLYEDKIYPVFREIGEIYEIRLMMNFSGTNRGFCFIMYKTPELAQAAINKLNNYEIMPGCFIGVLESVNNCRLHVTNLSSRLDVKALTKNIWTHCEDIEKILFYSFQNHPMRREALIYFNTHRSAAMARRRLLPERNVFFEKSDVRIDWAHPKLSITKAIEECAVYCSDDNVVVTKRVIRGRKKYFHEDYNKLEFKPNNRRQRPPPTYNKINASPAKIAHMNNNHLNDRVEKSQFYADYPKPAFIMNQNSYEQDSNHSNESFNDSKFQPFNESARYSVRSDESLSDFSKSSDSNEFRYVNQPNNYMPPFMYPGNCSVVKFPWGLRQNSYDYPPVVTNNFHHVKFPWNLLTGFNNVNNNSAIDRHAHISVFNSAIINNSQNARVQSDNDYFRRLMLRN